MQSCSLNLKQLEHDLLVDTYAYQFKSHKHRVHVLKLVKEAGKWSCAGLSVSMFPIEVIFQGMVIDVQLEQKFVQICVKLVHRTSQMEMYEGVAIYEVGINCCH